MPARSLVAVSATLATLGLALTAVAAPSSHRERHVPPRVHLSGIVSDWDADAGSITVEDAEVWGAPRRVRRALGAAPAIELTIGPRTRILTEDDDGLRAVTDEGDLFTAIEDSEDDLEVEAAGVVSPRVSRDPDAPPLVVARRIVLHLPSADDLGDDPGDDTGDAPDAEAPPDDAGPPVDGTDAQEPHREPRPPRR